ncbi:MAG TPA: DUF5694 domain-containing protein [Verrucomicrobiae bacterium]|nr:DUF5694 domain-containing protein [Verrucomicrobiae bacterium]
MAKFISITLLCIFLATSHQCLAQSRLDPDSILVGNRQQPQVFMIGTFHFAYFNFDAHKTAKDAQVDILSPQKQKELEQVVQYIARFKPTKIAIEAGANTGYLMRRYEKYLAGEHKLAKNEIEQIGFRLMERFKLDTIYGVDAAPLLNDLYNHKDSLILRPLLDSIYHDWDFQSTDTITKLYKIYYDWDDQITLQLPLLNYFKFLNSDKVLNRGFGAYLNGDFTLGKHRGADALAMHWYARNLRIYRNIQQIVTSPNDRILVIFGAGHIQILKHLFECSPEFKLIKFSEL